MGDLRLVGGRGQAVVTERPVQDVCEAPREGPVVPGQHGGGGGQARRAPEGGQGGEVRGGDVGGAGRARDGAQAPKLK